MGRYGRYNVPSVVVPTGRFRTALVAAGRFGRFVGRFIVGF